MLYSLSQCLDAQIKSGMNDNYLGGGLTRGRLLSVYFAAKMIHVPFTPGRGRGRAGRLACRPITRRSCSRTSTISIPKVVAVLEDYAAGGGLVLMTDDCQAQIKGAKRVGAAAPDLTAEIERVWAAGKQKESMQMRAAGLFFRAAKPLADALKDKLADAGIRPIVDCDNEQVVVSRQTQADIEYFFAVNAAWDEKEGTLLSIKPTTATIGFAADGRPVYDARAGRGRGRVERQARQRAISASAPARCGSLRGRPARSAACRFKPPSSPGTSRWMPRRSAS